MNNPQEKGVIRAAEEIAEKYRKTFKDLGVAERFEEWAINEMANGKLPTWADCSKWWLSEISSSNKALIEGILEMIDYENSFDEKGKSKFDKGCVKANENIKSRIIKYAQDKGITIN